MSDLAQAMLALGHASAQGTRSVTSDLTIDESLLLHGAGYEPVDLVTGVSVQSIPYGSFVVPLGQPAPIEIPYATRAVVDAFTASADRLRQDCARCGGEGVVGVDVEVEIGLQSVRVAAAGTAIRAIAARETLGRPFATDLSVRDFTLLGRSGWEPLDVVAGASFVAAPLRSARQLIAQTSQNVELTNLTQALQNAREAAMERMQRAALDAGANGVVAVSILDGPLARSRHVLSFVCYGTAVRLGDGGHRRLDLELVLPVDDRVRDFEARSLR